MTRESSNLCTVPEAENFSLLGLIPKCRYQCCCHFSLPSLLAYSDVYYCFEHKNIEKEYSVGHSQPHPTTTPCLETGLYGKSSETKIREKVSVKLRDDSSSGSFVTVRMNCPVKKMTDGLAMRLSKIVRNW